MGVKGKSRFRMRKQFVLLGIAAFIALIVGISSCKSSVNTVNDPHFDASGMSLDSAEATFEAIQPLSLNFYVEVSGSMNGFFRSNQATKFKKDAWSIISNFGGPDILILSNTGTVAETYTGAQFRSKMNTGGFVSNQETLVPTMIKTILDNLDYEKGECAVLISDMKYSPERQKDINVLLSQYQTDIRNEIGKHKDIAVSIILATSEYLSANNNVVAEESPYYYVIFGKAENVAFMRNCISTLLDDNGDYGESIETGFNYKAPVYSFGIPDNVLQLFDEPTFTGYDVNYSDTCTVKIKVDLSNYRWMITNEDVLRELISVKSSYGSNVKVGNIKIDVNNHADKELKRRAIAEFEIKVYDMFATESDVIEWTLNHPEYRASQWFTDIISATAENDYSGSFSMDRFIAGVFNARQNTWDNTPNRILISKVRQ